MPIKASIIGATGYAGVELVRLLLRHQNVKLSHLGSKSYAGDKLSKIYPMFMDICDITLEEPDLEGFSKDSDVIFVALPNGILNKEINQEILNRSVIIDLGADFRLVNPEKYEEWYKLKHYNKELLKTAVYGLVELKRNKIKNKRLIANPGCYTTTSILSLAPLMKKDYIDLSSIIIDAASGVTGAGRGLKVDNLYCEVDENYKAYGITNHRHTPEIEQELSELAGQEVTINFTPHLVPMERGILITAYINLNKDIKIEQIIKDYKNFYNNEKFIRILDGIDAQTKFVKGSNYLDISLKIDPRTNRLIVLGASDNLMKGAAGQAVQNMNVVFGFNESEGLNMVPDSLI